jgi:hypothetical protein
VKLLNCLACNDIVALTYTERSCFCHKASGYYLNDIDVLVNGACRILGMRNDQYAQSMNNNTQANYNWFVIAVSGSQGLIYKGRR